MLYRERGRYTNTQIITLNNLDLSNSEWTLETPLTVWEQAIDKFAIRILCQFKKGSEISALLFFIF